MYESMDMVILSKSSKYSGYCVAGIALDSGRLVRLVTSNKAAHGALFSRDLIMENGREAEVLDAVRVCGVSPCPGTIQTENYRIHSRTRLQFIEKLSIEAVASRFPQPRRRAVFRGVAPLIPTKDIGGIGHSLELLYVTDVTVYTVERNGKNRTRIDFKLNGSPMTGYSVTDPEFYGIEDGKKSFQAAYILCSLAEDEWADAHGYFKFVSSILSTTPTAAPATEKPENNGKPWKKEDDLLLFSMYESGQSVEEIAEHFGRTPGAISYRLIMYGMAEDGFEGISFLPGSKAIKNSELRDRLLHGETIAQLAERYGRTEKAIRMRLFYMGMGGKGPKVLPARDTQSGEAEPKALPPRKPGKSPNRKPHIVVAAFEPFGGAEVNASWEAVRRLEGVHKALLPVSFRRVRKAMRMILDSAPDAVLCVGEARGRAAMAVERVAVNLMDAQIADNDGLCPRDEAIYIDAPAAYLATLPTRRMVDEIREAGIPAELSYSAGTYVCNCTFYALMRAIEAAELPTLGGFIHVPARGTSAEELARGLEIAVGAIREALTGEK